MSDIFGGSYTTKYYPGRGSIRTYDDGRTETYDEQGRLLGSQGGVVREKTGFMENLKSLAPGGAKANFGGLARNVRDVGYDLSGADMYMSAMRGNLARAQRGQAPSFKNILRGAGGLLEGAFNVGSAAGGVAGTRAALAAGKSFVPALTRGITGVGAGNATFGRIAKSLLNPFAASPLGEVLQAGAYRIVSPETTQNQIIAANQASRAAESRGVVTTPTTTQVGNYDVGPYGAMPRRTAETDGGTAGDAAGGTTGGGTSGGEGGEDIGTELPALSPEQQAEFDRQRANLEQVYQDALARTARERSAASLERGEEIRAARRASVGGGVDVAAEAAEGGLGASPGIVQVAQEMLRQREAEQTTGANKRFLQIAAQLGISAADAKRLRDAGLSELDLLELTARAQMGMNYIPMGGS